MTYERTIEHLHAKRLVWHYTTLDALQLILESRTLLATEVNYQNDPREPETANDVIEEALRGLSKDSEYAAFSRSALQWFKTYRENNGFIDGRSGALIGESRFIFCASSDPDNLYAWRTYAAASRTGCAIGLDPEVPLGLVGDPNVTASVNYSRWSDVIYDPLELAGFAADKLKGVADLWNRVNAEDSDDAKRQEQQGTPEHEIEYRDHAFGVLITDFSKATAEITAVAKHASYAGEHETRLTASPASHAVVFSPGVDGPRPRVRVASSERWGQVLASAEDRLPIRAIVLAPNAGRQALTTAQWLLYANNYPLDPLPEIDESREPPLLYHDSSRVVSIVRSAHPYRQV